MISKIKDIVDQAHDYWNSWKYVNGMQQRKATRVYSILIAMKGSKDEQRAWSIVSTHQRLYTEVLRVRDLSDVNRRLF